MKSGSLNLLEPYGPSRPTMGLFYLKEEPNYISRRLFPALLFVTFTIPKVHAFSMTYKPTAD
jgi:hypothetical protein